MIQSNSLPENDEQLSRQLLAREAQEFEQMELVLGAEKPLMDRSEPEFRSTAENFMRDRPDVAKAAIKLLAADLPVRSICKRLNVSHHTLKELRYRCERDVIEQRKRLSEITFAGSMMALDKTIELLPSAKHARDTAIVAGILGDKYLQFSGQPTARIQVDASIDLGAELTKLFEEARQVRETMKAAVVVKELGEKSVL